jgi:hypothetical protein
MAASPGGNQDPNVDHEVQFNYVSSLYTHGERCSKDVDTKGHTLYSQCVQFLNVEQLRDEILGKNSQVFQLRKAVFDREHIRVGMATEKPSKWIHKISTR